MKTSTLLLVLAVLYVASQGGLGGGRSTSSTAVTGAAPPLPQPQPQSGGGDTFNSVLALITATANATGKALDLANDRNKPT